MFGGRMIGVASRLFDVVVLDGMRGRITSSIVLDLVQAGQTVALVEFHRPLGDMKPTVWEKVTLRTGQ